MNEAAMPSAYCCCCLACAGQICEGRRSYVRETKQICAVSTDTLPYSLVHELYQARRSAAMVPHSTKMNPSPRQLLFLVRADVGTQQGTARTVHEEANHAITAWQILEFACDI